MFCPKCGNQIGDNDTFCVRCGAELHLDKRRAQLAMGDPSDPSEPGEPRKKSARTAIVIAVLVAILVFAVVIGIALMLNASGLGGASQMSSSGQNAAQMQSSSGSEALSGSAASDAVSSNATQPSTNAQSEKSGGDAGGAGNAAAPNQSASSQAAPSEADYHIRTSDFEFDIPEYWRGKVNWSFSENDEHFSRVIVYPIVSRGEAVNDAGTPCNLITVEAVSPNSDATKNGGDIVSHRPCKVEGMNKAIVVHSTNWPVERAMRFMNDPGYRGSDSEEELYAALVDLSSNGRVSLSEVRESAAGVSSADDAYGEYAAYENEFLQSILQPTIAVVEDDAQSANQKPSDWEHSIAETANEFASLYIPTVQVDEYGSVSGIQGQYNRLLELVEPGTALEQEIAAKPHGSDGAIGTGTAIAVQDRVVTDVSGNTVTVSLQVSATQGNRSDWLDEANGIILYCEFSESGKVASVEREGDIMLTGHVS